MKTTLFTFTSLLCLTLLASSANAQVLKRLQDKTTGALERKIENKIDQKIEAMTEKMVENTFNSLFAEGEGNAGKGLPFGMNSNAVTEDVYKFDIVTTMEMESFKKNGKSEGKTDMLMHFNKSEMYTGTKIQNEDTKKSDSDIFIIYDFKNESMVMLMGSEGTKFSMAYDWKEALAYAEQMADEEEIDWENTEEWNSYKKIGTKTIAGYSCDGYLSETEEVKTEIWVTREETFGMENMFAANSNMKQMKGKVPAEYPNGMLMEMTSEDKNNGDRVVMKVTKIDKNASVSYKMADYPKMGMGGN
jgi:hypothetical protein